MSRKLVALATLALAACGGLESPDLEKGSLRGRLVGGRAGAYVYALGLPESKVTVGADGRFALEGLPAGDVVLAVLDGPDPVDGTRRAALVPAEVEGADESELDDLDAAAMPLAGRVWATVRPVGGAVPLAPRFTVTGTDQVDVGPGPTGLALLDPLPAGSFELAAAMTGYAPARTALVVPSGTLIQEVPLWVDPESEEPGCKATGACVNGLVCDVLEGECEACLADADCAAHGTGARCVDHECTVAGTDSGTGLVCAGCATDPDCASGVCAVDGGKGFCSTACALDWDCPAGFACRELEGRSVCVPPSGCDDYREDFGAPCFSESACAESLAGGICTGADPSAVPPRPGTCTATCVNTVPGSCGVVPGYTCDGAMALPGICVRP